VVLSSTPDILLLSTNESFGLIPAYRQNAFAGDTTKDAEQSYFRRKNFLQGNKNRVKPLLEKDEI
jgi:hypothetical protein